MSRDVRKPEECERCGKPQLLRRWWGEDLCDDCIIAEWPDDEPPETEDA